MGEGVCHLDKVRDLTGVALSTGNSITVLMGFSYKIKKTPKSEVPEIPDNCENIDTIFKIMITTKSNSTIFSV